MLDLIAREIADDLLLREVTPETTTAGGIQASAGVNSSTPAQRQDPLQGNPNRKQPAPVLSFVQVSDSAQHMKDRGLDLNVELAGIARGRP